MPASTLTAKTPLKVICSCENDQAVFQIVIFLKWDFVFVFLFHKVKWPAILFKHKLSNGNSDRYIGLGSSRGSINVGLTRR